MADVRLGTDPQRLSTSFDRLADAGVSVLVGEHVDEPESAIRSPADACRITRSLGLDAIVTITGRSRSRPDARAEVDAMCEHDPVAIHCVTGDHPAARGLAPADVRPFRVDSMELIDAVARAGGVASAAESPAAPPVGLRPARVLEKQRAGAGIVVLNHAGSAEDLVSFADAAHERGVSVPLVAPVPLVTDRESARGLAAFPGLLPPPGHLEAVVGADDPREAGIDGAARLAVTLLGSGRFAAVNLSGSGSGGGMVDRVAVICEVMARLDELSPGTGTP